MADDGWELDAVDAAVRQLSPSLAYLVVDNHNPTGMTLSEDGRRRLGAIIAETRTRTIIDETIADMWLDRPVPAPMAAFMPSDEFRYLVAACLILFGDHRILFVDLYAVDELDVGRAPPRRHQTIGRRAAVLIREDHGISKLTTANRRHDLAPHEDWQIRKPSDRIGTRI